MEDINIANEESGSARRLGELISVLKEREIMHGLTPLKLRLILEDLGPTFVKFGQIMSMRPDVLPQEYCDELVKLRTEVSPLPFEQIKQVIEGEYSASLDDIFESVEEISLGSASIAQVHRAVLKSGRKVVIKVQRPGIYDVMAQDMALLRKATTIVKIIHKSSAEVIDFNMVLEEMWSIAKQEMDFLMEASHNEEFRHFNRDVAHVTCPVVDRSLTTAHILVMEYIDGIRIDKAAELDDGAYDMNDIGLKLGQNYVKQIIDDGYFHADPHPGNIWLRDGRIVWLDLGMMGRLSNKDRGSIRRAILAIVNRDSLEMKNAVLEIGIPHGRINHAKLYDDIDGMMNRYASSELADLDVSEVLKNMIGIARTHRLGVAPGISMLVRGVVMLEGVLKMCCPRVNMVEILATHMEADFRNTFDFLHEWDKLKRDLYKLARKSIDIPAQISDILTMTIKGQTKMNLDLTGCEEPIKQFDKMINKLIVCIISAALLLASSVICTTQMSPRFMGIPLLGIFGYIGALVLCGKLLLSILKNG